MTLKNIMSDKQTHTKNEINPGQPAEETSTSNGDLYRSLFENAQDAIFIADPETGTLLDMNRSAELLTGYTRKELIGRHQTSIHPPQAFTFYRKEFQRAAKNRAAKFTEMEVLTKDGRHVPVEINSGGTIRVGDKKRHIGIFRDISERKQAENVLRESERKYRKLVEKLDDIIWATDLNLNTVYVSPAVEKKLGFTAQERMRQELASQMTPSSHQAIVDLFSTELRREQAGGADPDRTVRIETEFYHKNGAVFWYENVIGGTRDEKGNLIGLQGVSRDITDRKLAEKELQKQKRLFETMFNTIPDGVVVTNTRREIQLANKGMETTFGYKPEDLLGNSTAMLYAGQELYHKAGQEVFNKDAPKWGDRYIAHYKDKYGREFPGETFGAKLLDADGQWIGNLGIMRDVTEREQAQKRIQQAQKMESIGTLAGGIAHDFNNILASIIGYTEMSLDEIESGTTIEDNLQEVYRAGKRARDLVKQILTFARQSDEEVKPVQLDSIVKEVLKLIRATIPSTIDIHQHINSDSLILGNASQIHQVLMNLCTNAAHAMQDGGGSLNVSLNDITIDRIENQRNLDLPPGDYLELKVSDTGPGISPDIIDSIFEPYFTTKKPGEGTGMGLAIVHGVVESHGGKTIVESRLGQGATFAIYLPITKKRKSPSSYAADDLPTGTERILFVDDEAPIAKIGSQILERLGYRVTSRTSSVEALELFRSKFSDFDLVITDMTMPNMNGDQLALELTKIRPDIPVILCTGYSKKISGEHASALGIRAVAYKPVVKSEMAKTVRKVIDGVKDKTGKD